MEKLFETSRVIHPFIATALCRIAKLWTHPSINFSECWYFIHKMQSARLCRLIAVVLHDSKVLKRLSKRFWQQATLLQKLCGSNLILKNRQPTETKEKEQWFMHRDLCTLVKKVTVTTALSKQTASGFDSNDKVTSEPLLEGPSLLLSGSD